MKKPIIDFYRLFRLTGIFSLGLLFLASCDDDDNGGDMPDPAPTQTIVEIAQGNDQFEVLVDALGLADLVDDLSGTGPFTVFAPTDAAFEALLASADGIDELEDISQESLIEILQYHVANGRVLAADLSDGQEVPTLLSGESLTIGVSGNTVTVNGVDVVTADVEATNGVIHIIDEVLVPEGFVIEPAPQTIAEIATETESLSTLVAALQRAPDLLAAAGDATATLTVFAPSNDAFAQLLEEDPRFGSLDDIPDEVLIQILQYHILGSAKVGADLAETEATLLTDESLSIDKSDGVVINGNATVTTPDISAANGVVHLIDRVLVPEALAPQTIAEIAVDTDTLSTLVAALQRVPSLLEAAGDETATLTVFAPSNAAFAQLLEEDPRFETLDDISDEVLTQILQYHILGSTKLGADLTETEATLLTDESLSIDTSEGVVINGNTNVTGANVLAVNGVVHVIDRVLVPEALAPPSTIAQIADDTDDLSTLVAALERTPDLLEAAADFDGNITVFAPTNAAFGDLLTTLADATGNTFESLDDVPDYVLNRVLEYHILSMGKTAAELEATEETLEGSTISVDATAGVMINDANVVDGLANIEAANGVVHVIDAVLVPDFILSSLGTVLEPAIFDADGRFTTLVTAVETAELDGALTDMDAMLTVFAPTNDAFTAFIDGSDDFADADALLASDMLGDILLYHVLGSTVASGNITEGASSAPTLYDDDDDDETGEAVYISNNGEAGIFLNGGPQVIIPDLEEGNGIVHVIDGVLVPPMNSIAEIVVASAGADPAEFTLLLAALQNADDTDGDLVELLSSEDETYTVFAPTDAAFMAAGYADVAAIEAEDPATLRAVLLYHVVPGVVLSTDLVDGAVTTAGAADITITVADPVLIADLNADSADATVTMVNILATNGVIHVIDQVLLPE